MGFDAAACLPFAGAGVGQDEGAGDHRAAGADPGLHGQRDARPICFARSPVTTGADDSLDEIDTVFGPKAKDNEEVRGLLNAGHRRGATAGRCVVRGKVVETEELPAYAAVALAGLGWLPDTLLSRSIIIRMRRRHGDEQVESYRRRIVAARRARPGGDRDLGAIGAAGDPVAGHARRGYRSRRRLSGSRLLAVADLIGGDWPKRARNAAVALVEASREVEPSLGIRLLTDLRTIFGDSDAHGVEGHPAEALRIEEAPGAI